MTTESKPMDICRRFRAAFTENFGKAIQWCTNRDAVWVEEPGMLHSLCLLHYGHTICPPVWRVQINYVDPYSERSGWHTVKIGDTRYALMRGCFGYASSSIPLVSHHLARKQVCGELTFHASEAESVGEWLGELLSDPVSRCNPPVEFLMPDDEVVERMLSTDGYLWTYGAEACYDAARDQYDAREARRAERREARSKRNSGNGESPGSAFAET